MSTNFEVMKETPPPLGPVRRQIELRVGQIYRQRGKDPDRYVRVVQIRDDDSVVMQRIAPSPPNTLGRRSVRKLSSFRRIFDFVYEEVIESYCTRCRKKIVTKYYPNETKSDRCSADGRCYECFTARH